MNANLPQDSETLTLEKDENEINFEALKEEFVENIKNAQTTTINDGAAELYYAFVPLSRHTDYEDALKRGMELNPEGLFDQVIEDIASLNVETYRRKQLSYIPEGLKLIIEKAKRKKSELEYFELIEKGNAAAAETILIAKKPEELDEDQIIGAFKALLSGELPNKLPIDLKRLTRLISKFDTELYLADDNQFEDFEPTKKYTEKEFTEKMAKIHSYNLESTGDQKLDLSKARSPEETLEIAKKMNLIKE